jgi:hypothetical protein
MHNLETPWLGQEYDLIEDRHGEHRGAGRRALLRGLFRSQGRSALDPDQNREKCVGQRSNPQVLILRFLIQT